MNCKKCGAPLVENDQFCKNCGASVDEVNAQNNIGDNQSIFDQNEINNVQQPTNNNLNGQVENNYQQPMNNYQQPMNNYQQPMNNYQQPMNNQSAKSNNSKFILIGIGVAVAIVLVVVLVFVLFGNKNLDNKDNNVTSTVNNTSNYTVKFNNFTFKIPTNLVYETQENGIILGDEEGTWATFIAVSEGSYNQLLKTKNQIQSFYQQKGYTASSAVEKNIAGLNFITVELSMAGDNALIGYAKANSMYYFATEVRNLDNEFDYDALKSVSSVLKSAEFNNETNNMSTFERVDMSGISELAQ